MALPFILGAAISALLGPAAGVAAGVAAATGATIINELDLKESPSNSKELFTTEEAMTVLGMSKPTILKKMKEGLIPYEVAGGRGRGSFHIRREELEKYAANNNIVPDWGCDATPPTRTDNKASVEETIKLKELQREEAELDLEELELQPEDTIDYKRKLIQAKKKVASIEKEIQGWKIFLSYIEDKSEQLSQN